MLTKGICPKCKRQHRRLNQDEFFERCKEVHNNFYEYDETVPYTKLKKNIIALFAHSWSYYQIAGNSFKRCWLSYMLQILKNLLSILIIKKVLLKKQDKYMVIIMSTLVNMKEIV